MPTLRLPAHIAVSLGVIGACGEPAPPPDPAPVVWSGEWIEIATNGGVRECGGSREFLDRFASRVIEDQGLDIPPGERARLYVLTPEELRELGFCPPGTVCSYGRFAYTDVAIDKHETVHAVRGLRYGPRLVGPTFFEEGLATLYGKRGTVVDDQPRDVYAALDAPADGLRGWMPTRWYPVSADFLGFLSHESSLAEIVWLVEHLENANTVGDVAETVEAQTGESLDSLAARFEQDYPACSPVSRTRYVVECEQNPMVFDEFGQLEPMAELSCEMDNVLGPLDGRMWTSFTFSVEQEGDIQFRAPLADGGSDQPLASKCPGTELEVVDCDRGCLADPNLYVPWWKGLNGPGSFDDEVRHFLPGKYLVRLSREVDDPGLACVGIRLVE